MGKVVVLAGVGSKTYGVDVETGGYCSAGLRPPARWLLWVVGLCGPSTGYLVYVGTRRRAEVLNRWYFSVATGQVNVWVLVVTVVSAAVVGYGVGWFVFSRRRYVPVVLDRGLEVQVVQQARQVLQRGMRWVLLLFLVVVVVGIVFYWTSYLPSVLVIWVCSMLAFFGLSVCGVSRFRVVWGRWRELKREGLV